MSKLIKLPLEVGQVPEVPEKKLYFPFHVARELGKLDMDNVELQLLPDLLATVRSGRIPRHGGVYYDRAADGFGAVDLLAATQIGNIILLEPHLKDAVDADTRIVKLPGVTVISEPDETYTLASVARNRTFNDRLPRYGATSSPVICESVGSFGQPVRLEPIDVLPTWTNIDPASLPIGTIVTQVIQHR